LAVVDSAVEPAIAVDPDSVQGQQAVVALVAVQQQGLLVLLHLAVLLERLAEHYSVRLLRSNDVCV
jgi:hypothetical protein